MTTPVLVTRDERARLVLENVIGEALKSPPPASVVIAARDNYSGEPSFYISVTMPSERDIPTVAAQNRLASIMLAKLEQIEDGRFPYLFFGPREDVKPSEGRHSSPAGANP